MTNLVKSRCPYAEELVVVGHLSCPPSHAKNVGMQGDQQVFRKGNTKKNENREAQRERE